MIDFDTVLPALADFGASLVPGQIVTLPVAGGCWIAGFLSGNLPCFFIGGPWPPDYRIFATSEAALGAIAHHLNIMHAEQIQVVVRSNIRLSKPPQRDVGGGWFILQLTGLIGETYVVVSPTGPLEETRSSKQDAENAAYDGASSGLTY